MTISLLIADEITVPARNGSAHASTCRSWRESLVRVASAGTGLCHEGPANRTRTGWRYRCAPPGGSWRPIDRYSVRIAIFKAPEIPREKQGTLLMDADVQAVLTDKQDDWSGAAATRPVVSPSGPTGPGTLGPAYPPPATRPTQQGPTGIRFDMNEGARVVLPNRARGRWRVRLSDLDTGNTLFQSENKGALVSSSKRYYVRFGIEIWDINEAGEATTVLDHKYDASAREVLI